MNFLRVDKPWKGAALLGLAALLLGIFMSGLSWLTLLMAVVGAALGAASVAFPLKR